ncbi:SdpI family protein [Myxococcus llanfairpwllgwyngyllgogerychwyrndrobwllllantysiliogogogochensis]|uniref:SdpI family protein n=1 Tax=Myxococcus llanfairpwllgwyngyllgogerychwyrndrobwllllantysiliogogogochensis TaxID=2590453 RepID=A0A540X8H6_9BACT|nr:SdpI family protein [Myxococcus llanfairpwllgwyngyllgogerychwyrndrobwllllantysiliogogogochensis]TQF17532.1 SdpI family protein [Myxococcus llanfairpwllgwyngyllgogerychwyrndrobwllllantysiliogogogochensis]
MRISRANVLSLGLVIASFVMAAVLYSRLPEAIPTHWNARGVVDGHTPKPWGPFVLPLMMAGIYLLLVVLPRISPKGYRMERFQGVFEFVLATTLAFLFLMNALLLLAGIGTAVPMERVVPAATGLLFVLLGNVMGKLTKNFFVGIRTPWTLASDEVWLRTHRLGGRLFVLAGIVIFVSGLLGAGPNPVLVAVSIACIIPVIYSYVLYRRIEGGKGRSTNNEGPRRFV